jgi:DNA-binding transcriptional LysR family regulator
VSPALSSNDGDVVREWALDGCGIIVRSEWSIAEDLRSGRLISLLAPFRLPDANVVALVGPRGSRLARTTRFVHALRASLTPTPW